MKDVIDIINQLAQLELRIKGTADEGACERNFSRIKESLKNMGYDYKLPLYEKYAETSTDLEATITGTNTENLIIKNIVKPIIYRDNKLEQKGIVMVEAANENH
ncbi:MAG: hypothetical protein KG003_10265 [Bacteroidetes bacterium]|nr:hypothetical protein [Bacteroidota bacterium]